MDNGGFSHGRVADHFRVNHSIIVRLMQRVRQTGNVTDRPRASRPRKTTPRDDRLISRRERQRPFSTAGALRGNLAFGGHISTRTVIRRLHHQGMRARRPITRPQLTLRHRHADLTGHMITWGGLFAHGDGCTGLMKVVLFTPYRRSCKGLAPTKHFISDNHILGTTAFGGGV
jgi:transposase